MALLSGSILTAAHFLQVENPQPSEICSVPGGNKEFAPSKRSRLSLLLFTSFRRALLGDGSLRKLTKVAGSRNGHSPQTATRLDARERNDDDETPLCLGRIVQSCHARN